MKPGLAAGIFVVSASVLFTAGLYMIGTSHDMFSHHLDFYTELSNVNGLNIGMKVRVGGFSAGQVLEMKVPARPSEKFRLKLQMDDKLHTLIRNDSVVTVETDGLVGNKFLLIHSGTDQSQEAAAGATLRSIEPVELSAIIAKATEVVDQAHEVIGDVQVRLDTALDSVTRTVNDTDGLVGDARNGHGSVGVLLNDRETANRLKETIANADEASVNINQATIKAGQIVTDLQSRNLPAKVDNVVVNARHATQQLDQASQQISAALSDALGPDHSGATGAENIRESLSNVNVATANVADDTEAIKHEFFFKGYFKKRGYYNLGDLTTDQYRSNTYFQNPKNARAWLDANAAFTTDEKGNVVLSVGGRHAIDQIIEGQQDSIVNEPLVIEGYSSDSRIEIARAHASSVKQYLQRRFHLRATDIALVPLGSTPPKASGKSSWNGACIVFLSKRN